MSEKPDLLPLIAKGEADAVEQFVKRYQRLIWWLARQKGTPDPDDAVQEIFIDIWKSAGRFDPSKSSETSFISMIARRRLIDRRRKVMRTPISEDVETTVSDKLQVNTDHIERVAEARLAQRAIIQLQPDQRKVLELSMYQGYSHGEIAERTGIPLGTVKSHIRRGLIQVRELLGHGPGSAAQQPNQSEKDPS